MIKFLDKEGLSYLWTKIKSKFIKKPRNLEFAKTGNFLKYIDGNTTEWAEFPALLNYKGSVQTYDNLIAIENPSKGDVYTVTDQTNAEYFYNGTSWEFIGQMMDGFVKKTGDTMVGALKVNKGKGYYTKINDNAIEVYHEDGTTKALEAKRNKFELKSSDGTTIFKVDDGTYPYFQIGYNANKNSIILGDDNDIAISADHGRQLVIGGHNIIESETPTTYVFGECNHVYLPNEDYSGPSLLLGTLLKVRNYLNSIAVGTEIDLDIKSAGVNSSITVGHYTNIDGFVSSSAIFGAGHVITAPSGVDNVLMSGFNCRVKQRRDEFLYNGFDYSGERDTVATGSCSTILGCDNDVSGNKALVHGSECKSYGENSHAEGYLCKTYGADSHAEGNNTVALGKKSHAEGKESTAYGHGGHAEGLLTTAGGVNSLYNSSQTLDTITLVSNNPWKYRVVQQYRQIPVSLVNYIVREDGKIYSVENWTISGLTYTFELDPNLLDSYFNGLNVTNYKYCYTTKEPKDEHFGNYSHAEGNGTSALGDYSHAEGVNTRSEGESSHAEGNGTSALGDYSHAEGVSDTTSIAAYWVKDSSGCLEFDGGKLPWYDDDLLIIPIEYSLLMHDLVLITYNGKEYRCYTLNRESYNAGSFSHNYSESKKWDILRCEVFNGASTTLSDVPEDTLLNITIEIPRGEIEGTGCHGEGYNNTIYAEAEYSHAEGVANVITGSGTHVEGSSNIGSGDYSFTTGLSNHTVGIGGITLGTDNYNAGTCGITIGHTLYTNSAQSIILGQFNVPNAYNDEAVLIVGNGYGKTPHGYENYQHDALVIKKGSSSDIIIGDSIVFTSGSTILTLGNTGASLRIGSTTLTLNETKLKKLITLLS